MNFVNPKMIKNAYAEHMILNDGMDKYVWLAYFTLMQQELSIFPVKSVL